MYPKKVEIKENIAGGIGFIKFEHLINEKASDKCRMFTSVTIRPGESIGEHPHFGETETYYILSGSGTYCDNGTEKEIKAGDVLHCKDGDTHAIKNTGNTDLVFIALILLTN